MRKKKCSLNLCNGSGLIHIGEYESSEGTVVKQNICQCSIGRAFKRARQKGEKK